MVLTVLVLNLNAISDRPVPYWVHRILVDYIGRLFCGCGATSSSGSRCGGARAGGGAGGGGECGSVSGGYHKQTQLKRVTQYGPTMNTRIHDDLEEEVPIIALNGSATSAQETSFAFLNSRHSSDMGGSTGVRTHSVTGRTGVELKDKPDYSKDWQQLAEVVDRLFFWSFLLAIVGISLLLFHPLTKQRPVPDEPH